MCVTYSVVFSCVVVVFPHSAEKIENIFQISLFGAFRSRTAFENGKTDVFRIRTHNVGLLKKIRCSILSAAREFMTGVQQSRCVGWFREWFDSSAFTGLSMTTLAWVPAGSWTEWWWQMCSGLIWGFILPAITGWAKRREMAFMSETCWAAQTPWIYPNVWTQACHSDS